MNGCVRQPVIGRGYSLSEVFTTEPACVTLTSSKRDSHAKKVSYFSSVKMSLGGGTGGRKP